MSKQISINKICKINGLCSEIINDEIGVAISLEDLSDEMVQIIQVMLKRKYSEDVHVRNKEPEAKYVYLTLFPQTDNGVCFALSIEVGSKNEEDIYDTIHIDLDAVSDGLNNRILTKDEKNALVEIFKKAFMRKFGI